MLAADRKEIAKTQNERLRQLKDIEGKVNTLELQLIFK